MTDYTFLKAEGEDGLAGGSAYIASLVTALRAAGHHVDVTAATGPAPGQVHVIDGLTLRHVDAGVAAGAVGLVHHVAALTEHASKAAVRETERANLVLMRRVIATNHAAAADLVALGLDATRVLTILPGVSDAVQRVATTTCPCEILTIGALVPRKGHDVLISALTRLFDLDWHLTIVGDMRRDPATTAALRELADAVSGRVMFAGLLDPAAIEAAWQRTDVFALATRWEGYAASVAEALRRGIPVAVTAGGDAASNVTPQVGIVCEPGDVVQLSKALRRMIYDTALRAEMADAAWQAGQKFPNWAQQALRFAQAVA